VLRWRWRSALRMLHREILREGVYCHLLDWADVHRSWHMRRPHLDKQHCSVMCAKLRRHSTCTNCCKRHQLCKACCGYHCQPFVPQATWNFNRIGATIDEVSRQILRRAIAVNHGLHRLVQFVAVGQSHRCRLALV